MRWIGAVAALKQHGRVHAAAVDVTDETSIGGARRTR